MTDEVTVTRNDDEARYEIRLGDALAGFAQFRLREGEIQFVHTEVDPAFRGKGLAQTLAEEALTDAAASGATIVPYCPFIAGYLQENGTGGANIRWPQQPEDPAQKTAE